jgi:hypothetical protein
MSILDDAIREHLELKRAHGADDVELKKLEDEAFGPPARPDEPVDAFAEAPTEFLTTPESGAGEQSDEAGPATRRLDIADLQEAPVPPAPLAPEPDAPAEEEQPAMEHETIPDPPPAPAPEPTPEIDGGHSTEERHAIAEQPTEIFDVEGEFDDTAAETEAPSEEQLVDAELSEPRLTRVDPLTEIDDAGGELEISDERDAVAFDEDDDDFFSEQRLSDELNQALATPLPGEPGSPPTEEAEAVVAAPEEEDVAEEDSGEWVEEEESGEFDAEEGDEDEGDFEEDEEDDAPAAAQTEERTQVHQLPDPPPPPPKEDDLLEHTPDFLEDAPEDDNLWFEQKPPKDFDFDD